MTASWLRLAQASLLCLPLLAAQQAYAQYSWIDDHGTRVFSDQPPPPDVPASKIIKGGRAAPPAATSTGAPAAAAAASSAASSAPADLAPPSLAQREEDYRKRMKKRDEDAAKASKEREEKAKRAEYCQALRQNQAGLNSGRRVSRTTESGEQAYLSDDERNREAAKVQRAMAQECNR